MAFTIASRTYNNAKEKAITAYIRSITPNGITPPTPTEYVNARIDALEVEVAAAIAAINAERRRVALESASASTITTVNTALGIVNYEDLP